MSAEPARETVESGLADPSGTMLWAVYYVPDDPEKPEVVMGRGEQESEVREIAAMSVVPAGGRLEISGPGVEGREVVKTSPRVDTDELDEPLPVDELETEIVRENEETTKPEEIVDDEPEPATDEGAKPEAELQTVPGDETGAGTVTPIAKSVEAARIAAEEKAARELEAAAAAGADTDALFEAKDYESEKLALPKIDGMAVDAIEIAFTGKIKLDRSDEDDVALYKRISQGAEVELRVAGVHAGTASVVDEAKDGSKTTIGRKTLRISTVYVLSPEEL